MERLSVFADHTTEFLRNMASRLSDTSTAQPGSVLSTETAESSPSRGAAYNATPDTGVGGSVRPTEQRDDQGRAPRTAQQSAARSLGETEREIDAGQDQRISGSIGPVIKGTDTPAPTATAGELAPTQADFFRAAPVTQGNGANGSDAIALGEPTAELAAGASARPSPAVAVRHSGATAPTPPETGVQTSASMTTTSQAVNTQSSPESSAEGDVLPSVRRPAMGIRQTPPPDDRETASAADLGTSELLRDRMERPLVSVDQAEPHDNDSVALKTHLPQSDTSIRGKTDMQRLGAELTSLGYPVQEHESGSLSLNLQEEVPFAFDSAEIPPGAIRVLQELTDVFLRNAGMKVTIIGHTDDSGPQEYNRNLSLLRARTVERYLMRQGLARTRLSSQGLGEDAPLSEDEGDGTSGSRQRRIEILLEPISN
jgi:outer membrane protein OmpA-like peptidoglycan-associated protein